MVDLVPGNPPSAHRDIQPASQQLLELLERISDPFYALDRQWRFTYVNHAAEQLWNQPREMLIGQVVWDVFPKSIGTPMYDALCRAASEQRRTQCEPYSTFLSCWSEVTVYPAQDGLSVHFHDITERKRRDEQLRYLSTHDALTGLYNRAYFEEVTARLEQAGPFPVSVIVADVDGMKRVNDAEGHAAGDALLRHAAAALRATLPEGDLIARTGGDEFVVVLPATDAAAGMAVLERLKSKVVEQNTESVGESVGNSVGTPLSLSLGLAVADRPHRLAEVLRQADREMYKEKQRRHLQDMDSVRQLAALVTASDEAIIGIAVDGTINN